jgi:Protein of unknown function (DUF5672)
MIMRRGKKTVAVVVPWYRRTTVTPDEEISFRHLEHFLGRHERFLIVPNGLTISLPGFKMKPVPSRYFGSPQANTRLMLSRWFYQMFSEYNYILIYQSDALVLSDRLLEWCELDLDYVGAPFIRCADTPLVNPPRVGNGGFSLRRVQSFLKVIDSKRYWVEPSQYWKEVYASRPRPVRLLNLPRKWLKLLVRFNGARREMAQWHLKDERRRNEDNFWSDEAVRYYPDFRIAAVETGLRFAFEVAPRHCYELNGRQLPFGAHAWPKYDRAFWEPYLQR